MRTASDAAAILAAASLSAQPSAPFRLGEARGQVRREAVAHRLGAAQRRWAIRKSGERREKLANLYIAASRHVIQSLTM